MQVPGHNYKGPGALNVKMTAFDLTFLDCPAAAAVAAVAGLKYCFYATNSICHKFSGPRGVRWVICGILHSVTGVRGDG